MMYRILFLMAMSLPFTAPAQLHTDILEGMEGQALLDALAQNYKPSGPLDYGDARDHLMGEVDNYDGYATCLYTGHQVIIPDGSDPSGAAYLDGGSEAINTEHVYPQSKFSGDGNPRADLHHLFATRAVVNSARASDPFAEINDEVANKWYYLNMEQSNPPSVSERDVYSEDTNSYFEPREDAKGNVARAMFYFYTMYKSQADAADPNFFNGQLPTLCDWHYADPADQAEIERTWRAATHQSNLPNPYVLDCSLPVRAGFCEAASSECDAAVPVDMHWAEAAALEVSPNPVTTDMAIRMTTKSPRATLKVYDVLGQVVLSTVAPTDVPFILNVQGFPRGVLFVRMETEEGVFTQRVMH